MIFISELLKVLFPCKEMIDQKLKDGEIVWLQKSTGAPQDIPKDLKDLWLLSSRL